VSERSAVVALERVACPSCGGHESEHFTDAQDDLGGKPGTFTFVRCSCGLVFQNPRLPLEAIKPWYDEQYLSHRKKRDFGLLTPLFERAFEAHDRRKMSLVAGHVTLGPESEVLDVGCGAGTFLARLKKTTGAQVAGVDFKEELATLPWFEGVELHSGLFYEQHLEAGRFDLVTMWHFLEHCYDPLRSLEEAKRVVAPRTGRIIIEVPRLGSLTWKLYRERWPGLQAPQHTVLFTKETLLDLVRKAGLEVVEWLPYGAFPAYFYVFTGAAFKFLKGKGLDLDKAIAPYFFGQLLLAPLLLFERRLDLAMQTVVCSA
jgi:2-polyprenyl-3-methyl-5-hydroxy-6-metoxy-1,4-benzoquinol methylase